MTGNHIQRVAVVGAGLMGHGIAQEFALAGFNVYLHSRTEATLAKARERIDENLSFLVDRQLISSSEATAVGSHLRSSTNLEESVATADLVIESVFEDLALKRHVFADLDRLCPDHAILASNTSGLMPDTFANATCRPDRVLVTHYANPPHLIPLVEVVPNRKTSEKTLSTVCRLLEQIGKRPIVVHKQVPGFVLNRLQCALLREALWLVENKVATAQDIDYAISNSIGRRWSVAGIFQVFEIPGWDLVGSIAKNILPDLSTTSEVSPVLRNKVVAGEVGVKTGKGFYDWSEESATELKQRIADALVAIEKWK